MTRSLTPDGVPGAAGRWHFGPFVLDTDSRELSGNGLQVVLERRCFAVLNCLLQHADQVVSRQRLLELAWPGQIVGAAAVSKAVLRLRAALGPQAQTLLKTLHGDGYRLACSAIREQPRQPAATLHLHAGASLPWRPHWLLEQCVGLEQAGQIWMARHASTGARHLLQVALAAPHLHALQQRIQALTALRRLHSWDDRLLRGLEWQLEATHGWLEFDAAAGLPLPLAWIQLSDPARREAVLEQIGHCVAAAARAGVSAEPLASALIVLDAQQPGMPRIRMAGFTGLCAPLQAPQATAMASRCVLQLREQLSGAAAVDQDPPPDATALPTQRPTIVAEAIVAEPAAEPTHAAWSFLGMQLIPHNRELLRDGVRHALPRKACLTLQLLLERAGTVVSKDALLQQAWAGREVSESVLTKVIAQLRRLLDDRDQRLVRTVVGLGYCLEAQPLRVDPCAPPASDGARQTGEPVEGRPPWLRQRRLGDNPAAEVWLIGHPAAGEQRVLKYCPREQDLRGLKREITVSRLLSQTLGPQAPHVPILDWNLVRRPFWIELPYLPDGSLLEWWQQRSGRWLLEERLHLAAQIAEALSCVHRLGVLHRDLKPANVLMARDDSGQLLPRLADFGCAQLLEDAQLARLGITRLGFTLAPGQPPSGGGTLLYLAPEVVRGAPFTLASDLYALGVLLYQLAMDDLLQPVALGWERRIDDPLLRADIAALLEGDPQLRPTDAGAVARGLRQLPQRHLQAEQQARLHAQHEQNQRVLVQARRRRQRIASLAAVLLVALLLTGGLYWRAQTALELAEAQRVRADQHAARATAISDFLSKDLLSVVDPWVSGNRQRHTTVHQAIELARARIGERFADQPGLEALLRLRMGLSLRHLDDYHGALNELQRALPLADDTGTRAEILLTMVDANLRKGAWQPAIAAAQQYLQLEDPDPSRPLLAHCRIATAWHRQGHYEQAAAAYRELLPRSLQRLGNHRVTTAFIMSGLAEVLADAGQLDEALRLQDEVAARHVESYGREHLLSITQLRRLGSIHLRMEQLDQAAELLLHSHRLSRLKLGVDHSSSQDAARELAGLQLARGHSDAALSLLREVLDVELEQHGAQHYRVRLSERELGRALLIAGDSQTALHHLESAHRLYLQHDGPAHPLTLRAALELSRALAALDRLAAAQLLLEQALQLALQTRPAQDLLTAELQQAQAELHLLQQQPLEAAALARLALQTFGLRLGSAHSLTRRAGQLAADPATLSAVNQLPEPAHTAPDH